MATPNAEIPKDIYLPDSRYELLLETIMRPACPECHRSKVVEALGEIGGIWPASIRPDDNTMK